MYVYFSFWFHLLKGEGGGGVLMLDVHFFFSCFKQVMYNYSLWTFDRGSYVPAFIPIPSLIGFGSTLSCTSIKAWCFFKCGSFVDMLCWVIDICGVCFNFGVSWSLAFQICVKFIGHFLCILRYCKQEQLEHIELNISIMHLTVIDGVKLFHFKLD